MDLARQRIMIRYCIREAAKARKSYRRDRAGMRRNRATQWAFESYAQSAENAADERLRLLEMLAYFRRGEEPPDRYFIHDEPFRSKDWSEED